MKTQAGRLFVGSLAALLITTGVAFARGGSAHGSSERKTDITFANTVKLQNGVTLPAGTYRMEVPENTQTPNVTFSQDNKVVATAAASLVSEPTKNPSTEIDSVTDGSADKVTAIRPGGWKAALNFSAKGQ